MICLSRSNWFFVIYSKKIYRWANTPESRIENTSNAIAQGIIPPTTKRMLEQAENDRAQLLHRRNELQSIGVYPVTVEQVIFWLEKFRDFDIANSHTEAKSAAEVQFKIQTP